MISSMTGFAAAVHESAQGSLAVELKTVNHRYLEFQARIPEELRPIEPAMREAIADAARAPRSHGGAGEGGPATHARDDPRFPGEARGAARGGECGALGRAHPPGGGALRRAHRRRRRALEAGGAPGRSAPRA